jgi:hypothetical protein
MGLAENKATLFACIESFNTCTAEWVDTFYSKGLSWREMPSASFPKGRSGGFKEFRLAAEGRLRVFPDFRLDVVKCVAEGDDVVFEQDSRGTLAIPFGEHKPGDVFKLKVVTFFKLKDGLVIEHTDFVAQMS